jgi:hypothetical protein
LQTEFSGIPSGPQAGIYRLIGLDDAGKPATLDRICGRDQTGTLYIGSEGKNFVGSGSRLSKLVRSLREPMALNTRSSGLTAFTRIA